MPQRNSRKLKQNGHPPSFVCPLSYQVMEDPVSDLCAHTFERQAIEAWLDRGNACCPISRKSLSRNDLKPNHVLAERIEKWRWEQAHADVMILRATTAASSEPDDDGDLSIGGETERSEEDIELGRPISASGATMMKVYQVVPTRMMLLPQEREALEKLRSRNKTIRDQRKRQKCCYCSLATMAVVVLIAFITIYWVKRRLDDEESLAVDDNSLAP